ncbi:hypothetical protein ACNKHX_25045 [Shigella flexneri]
MVASARLATVITAATYPSDLAAIQFDRSGTTHIGRFVINHSFILGVDWCERMVRLGSIFAAMYGFLSLHFACRP